MRIIYNNSNFFEIPWQPKFMLKQIEELWDDIGEIPGIYIVMMDKQISRVGNNDFKGILYVGKSLKLIKRLNNFWNANHPASGLLYTHLDLAQLVLQSKLQTENELIKLIGEIKIKIAAPITRDQLEQAEQAVLMAYMMNYGELPPLNFSMPGGRWQKPDASSFDWAERGILEK